MLRKTILFICLTSVVFSLSQAGPIHDAANSGDLAQVKAVLKANPDQVQTKDSHNNTPLHIAAIGGHLEVVRYLLDAGADINAGDNENSSAIVNACLRGHLDIVKLMVERGASVTMADENLMTPLHFAALGGNVEIIGLLLDRGADINAANSFGTTPLMNAAGRQPVEAVELLVQRGADVEVQTNLGQSVLASAARGGSVQICETFIAAGADVNDTDSLNSTPMIEAARRGRSEIVDLLVQHDASVNVANSSGTTPLHNAARHGHGSVASILIKKGADPNHQDGNGRSPLWYAVRQGHTDICAALLNAGAEVTKQEITKGWTPLHLAATKGYVDIAEALLAAGADADAKDNDGQTPAYMANYYGNKQIADLLVSAVGKKGEGYDGSVDLKKALADGEAVVWYLGHSSWAVTTQNHLLIFDYVPFGRHSDDPALANGLINPDEIKGRKVVVFATHAHSDHYDSAIFDWRETIADIQYVIGFEPDNVTGFEYIPPRGKRTLGDLTVSTIPANDGGEGFVVQVDGLVIFHGADHANNDMSIAKSFSDEIDYIAQSGVQVDLAFMGITGCSLGRPPEVKAGVVYAIEKLAPKALFPQHSLGQEHRYQEFADEVAERNFPTKINCAVNRGDRFFYSSEAPVN